MLIIIDVIMSRKKSTPNRIRTCDLRFRKPKTILYYLVSINHVTDL